MANPYTAVHWLGSERLIEHFTAPDPEEAGEAFDEMGWNSYDDRRLFSGHKTPDDVDAWESTHRR